MKKIFLIILIVFTLCCFAACDDYEENTKNITENTIENMGFIPIENIYLHGDSCAYVVYDPATKVEYIVFDGYRSFSICPYYDENGDVAIYGGE
jgi:hypothetical protein